MAFPHGFWFHIMVYVVNPRQYLLKFLLPFLTPKPDSLFRIAVPPRLCHIFWHHMKASRAPMHNLQKLHNYFTHIF